MIDQLRFEERCAEFFCGLNEDQQAGTSSFEPSSSPSSSFGSRAHRAMEPADKSVLVSNTQSMNDITRAELSSALSAIEERMDKRMDRADRQADGRAQVMKEEMALRDTSFRIERELRDKAADERFQSFLALQAEHDKVIGAKLDSITEKVSMVASKVDGFEAKIDQTVSKVRRSNWATLGGFVTIGAAIVLGVWGVNSTIISSASGIFSSGQESQKAQQANGQVLKDTQDLLRQLKQSQSPPEATNNQ